MRNNRYVSWIIVAIMIAAATAVDVFPGGSRIERKLLIEDVRQLADILESAHPQPYYHGGGRMAFHKRLQHILTSIPAAGMTRREFALKVAPLAASLGDGHTAVHVPYPGNAEGSGVPLELAVIERSLYVTGAPGDGERKLIGSLLLSVEDVPVAELAERVARLRGVDNEYAALLHLSDGGELRSGSRLGDLLPEWRDRTKVRVALRSPDGATVEKVFRLPVPAEVPFSRVEGSRVAIPSTERADITYGFMDDERRVAFLRVADMTSYREAYELNGTDYARETMHRAYRRYNGTAPPDDLQETLDGIPSATETFRSLVVEMRRAETKALIVDVRDNQGGVSLMNDMLVWFLFGKEEYLRVKASTATDVIKLSGKYFAERPGTSLENINSGHSFDLRVDDYDLRYDCVGNPGKMSQLDVAGIMDGVLRRMPSFYGEYASGELAGYYRPDKIVVLCNAKTFSGGYSLMWWLYRFGATVVGTPSGQAGNSFRDVLAFQLKNSGLYGQVSTKYQANFPDDPERGRVLHPHYPLTYRYLAGTGFDPNAEVLLAMDWLDEVPGLQGK